MAILLASFPSDLFFSELEKFLTCRVTLAFLVAQDEIAPILTIISICHDLRIYCFCATADNRWRSRSRYAPHKI